MARSRKQAIAPPLNLKNDALKTLNADERAAMTQRLTDLYNRVQAEALEERRTTLLKWSQWAP